jgi:hypothetical protein
MQNPAEKRVRFLGDFSAICEEPIDPNNDALLTQVHFSRFDSLGVSPTGLMLNLTGAIFLVGILLPAIGIKLDDGVSASEISIILATATLVIAAGTAISWGINRRRIAEVSDYLSEVLEELSHYNNALDDYLLELEQKFPPLIISSVTTTKIMHYFMLVQLRETLGPLIEEVRVLLSQRSIASTWAALELLQGTLQLSPAAGPTLTGMVEVPLYNLPKVLEHLALHLHELLIQIGNGRSDLSPMDGRPQFESQIHPNR